MSKEVKLHAKFIAEEAEMRQYDAFLHHKVEVSRASMRAGLGQSNDEVERKFAARRTTTLVNSYSLLAFK